MEEAVPMSALCRMTGLSERGLRNAFYSVRGVSPSRYIQAERLRRARYALTQASARPVTVTSVATNLGFYQLGRFAAAYKEAFGEAPSVTLRMSRRDESGNALL
jgi:transcriptional regulator GlxA family with amidase domain